MLAPSPQKRSDGPGFIMHTAAQAADPRKMVDFKFREEVISVFIRDRVLTPVSWLNSSLDNYLPSY